MDTFARHHSLDGIGTSGQQCITAGRILIVGVGGLGSPVARYLAAAGIGHLSLCDFGTIDAPDLQRQILYGERDVGQGKAATAASRLQEAHPALAIDVLEKPFSPAMIHGHDVVIDGTDEPGTRAWVHQACLQANVPMVWGGLEAWTGQVTTMTSEGPCIECILPRDLAAPVCSDVGVFGPLAGTIGTIMAGEALQVLLGRAALQGRLLVWDAHAGETQMISYGKRPDCPACGDR